jgi:hypothetical protein
MIDLLIVAAPALALATLYCLWRAAHLVGSWRPAVASVTRSDYDAGQQSEDFWSFGFTLFTSRGWNWRDGKNGRLIEDDIQFEDGEGQPHRATIQRRVRRGWRPSSVYTVWYDPADPAKVTAFGPGYWILLAFVWGASLACLFNLGTKLAGRIG